MSGLTKFLMHEVEMPLVPIVAAMEEVGYGIDREHFYKLQHRVETEMDAIMPKIQEHAGPDFNPGSSRQVAGLLFDRLGLPVLERTEKGQPSTKTAVLERLDDRHAVVRELIRYRRLDKIRGTYCKVPDKLDADGRLRVAFNPLDAATGRFTSGSIIQTIPKDADEFNIRGGFVASGGHQIVAADFSQQELRILAQVSGDSNMRLAIAEGTDLHGLAAVKVFGLECQPNKVDQLHPDKRHRIKAIQFGLIYGKSPQGVSRDLGISLVEAQQLLDDYFKQFPKVRGMIDEVHRRVSRDGFIDDVFGRRRHLPAATLKRPKKKWTNMSDDERDVVRKINRAKRQAQNFVIQGAAATITKLAMIRSYNHIVAEHPDIKMLLQLHDELQFEVPDELVGHFVAELPELMCNLGLERFGFEVPMDVDVQIGDSWGALNPWKRKEPHHVEERNPE